MFPSLPNSTASRCFKAKCHCREPVQRWHRHRQCCRRRRGSMWHKGQSVCGVVQVLNMGEIPPELLVSRGDFAPPSLGQSQQLLHQRCRAPGCGAALHLCPALKTAPKSEQCRDAPGAPSLPKITCSPHAGARHGQHLHTRSARVGEQTSQTPQLPQD